jgi:transcriptional regulator with XRE-family HTH domain
MWDGRHIVLQKLLRDVRKEAHLTQSDLASRLSKPQSYVSKYESGERRLDILEIQGVCSQCGLTLSAFSSRLEQELGKGRNDKPQ